MILLHLLPLYLPPHLLCAVLYAKNVNLGWAKVEIAQLLKLNDDENRGRIKSKFANKAVEWVYRGCGFCLVGTWGHVWSWMWDESTFRENLSEASLCIVPCSITVRRCIPIPKSQPNVRSAYPIVKKCQKELKCESQRSTIFSRSILYVPLMNHWTQ